MNRRRGPHRRLLRAEADQSLIVRKLRGKLQRLVVLPSTIEKWIFGPEAFLINGPSAHRDSSPAVDILVGRREGLQRLCSADPTLIHRRRSVPTDPNVDSSCKSVRAPKPVPPSAEAFPDHAGPAMSQCTHGTATGTN